MRGSSVLHRQRFNDWSPGYDGGTANEGGKVDKGLKETRWTLMAVCMGQVVSEMLNLVELILNTSSVWKLDSIVGLAWQLCNFIFVQWKIGIRMPRLAKCLPGGRYQLVWVTWGIGLEPEKTSPTGQSLMHFHSFKLYLISSLTTSQPITTQMTQPRNPSRKYSVKRSKLQPDPIVLRLELQIPLQ